MYYQHASTSVENLREITVNAYNAPTPRSLQNIIHGQKQGLVRRARLCIKNNGINLEHLLSHILSRLFVHFITVKKLLAYISLVSFFVYTANGRRQKFSKPLWW